MGSLVLNITFGFIFLLFTSSSNAEAQEIMAGEIVISYKKTTEESKIKQIETKYGLTRIGEIKTIGAILYSVTEDDVLQKIEILKKEPLVRYAEPNFSQKTYTSLNDPLLSQQWYLDRIKHAQALQRILDAYYSFYTTYVAVVDTGVSKYHRELDVSYEKDYVDNDDDANDESDVGHGTLVAGIIGAAQDNSTGVAGISRQYSGLFRSGRTPICALRTSDQFGNSDQFKNAEAIIQAVDWGCDIINCSFGSPNATNALYEAIATANSKGVLVVCAAGNDGVNTDYSPRYPASYDLPNIISVASSDRNDNLASDSNFGFTTVDIAAPGVDILNCSVNPDRVSIASWSFDSDYYGRENWDGWSRGFFEWGVGGLLTRRYISSYWPNIESSTESPTVFCSNYHSVKATFQIAGNLGNGDYLYLGSKKGYSSKDHRTFTTGNLTGSYSISMPDLDQQTGQIYFKYKTDSTGDGFLGLMSASVSGKAADLSSNSTYRTVSGTSFAAPVISGVAAFLMGYMPSKTHLEIKDAILRTARKTSSLNGKVLTGGVVDLDAAIYYLLNPGLLITSDVNPASITLNTPFSHQITASGSPTSFGAIGLPPGLKLNAKTGLISGKPTKVGVFSTTLQALKKGSTTATATKVFTVVQVPTFSYPARINAQRNKNVNVRPKVAGSPAPSFSVVSGSLPPGLSLNPSTAAITGTSTTIGTYPFTVRGSNSAGNTDRSTTIVVK
jgi:subtilisin family serine protease